MPNMHTCKLHLEGDEQDVKVFLNRFKMNIGVETMDETLSLGGNYVTLMFDIAYRPPIKYIKQIYNDLELDLDFWIKITLIYYEIGEGIYGSFIHTTGYGTEYCEYHIQEDDLYDTDEHNRPCVLKQNGNHSKDNYPAHQIAGGNFAKLLTKYSMNTHIASY